MCFYVGVDEVDFGNFFVDVVVVCSDIVINCFYGRLCCGEVGCWYGE